MDSAGTNEKSNDNLAGNHINGEETKKEKKRDFSHICCKKASELISNEKLNEVCFIIDCRSVHEYNYGHIKRSINIFTQKQLFEFFNEYENKCMMLIFYCEYGFKESPKYARMFREYETKKQGENKHARNELFVIEGGYAYFSKEFPLLCFGEYVSYNDVRINELVTKEKMRIDLKKKTMPFNTQKNEVAGFNNRIFKVTIKEGDRECLLFSCNNEIYNVLVINCVIHFNCVARKETPCYGKLHFYSMSNEGLVSINSDDFFVFKVSVCRTIHDKPQVIKSEVYCLCLGELVDIPVFYVGNTIVVELLPYLPKESTGKISFLESLACCFLPFLPQIREYNENYPLVSWLRDYQVNGNADWEKLMLWFESDDIDLGDYRIHKNLFKEGAELKETDCYFLSDFARKFFEEFINETGINGRYLYDFSDDVQSTFDGIPDLIFLDGRRENDVLFRDPYRIVSSMVSVNGEFNAYVSTPCVIPAFDSVYRISNTMHLLDDNVIAFSIAKRRGNENHAFGYRSMFLIYASQRFFKIIGAFQPVHPFYTLNEKPDVYEFNDYNIVKANELMSESLFFVYDKEKCIFSALPLNGPYGKSILQIPLKSINQSVLNSPFQCVMVKYGDSLFPFVTSKTTVPDLLVKVAKFLPFVKWFLIKIKGSMALDDTLDATELFNQKIIGNMSQFSHLAASMIPYKCSAKTLLDDIKYYKGASFADSLKSVSIRELLTLFFGISPDSSMKARKALIAIIDNWSLQEFDVCRVVANQITKVFPKFPKINKASNGFDLPIPVDGIVVIKHNNYATQCNKLIIANYVSIVKSVNNERIYFTSTSIPSLWNVPADFESNAIFITSSTNEKKKRAYDSLGIFQENKIPFVDTKRDEL